MNALLSPRRVSAARLLFAEDFDLRSPASRSSSRPPSPRSSRRMFTAADIEAARDAAWSDGREAGRRRGGAAGRAPLAQALAAIAAGLGDASSEARGARRSRPPRRSRACCWTR